jgi:hypothetical protein
VSWIEALLAEQQDWSPYRQVSTTIPPMPAAMELDYQHHPEVRTWITNQQLEAEGWPSATILWR